MGNETEALIDTACLAVAKAEQKGAEVAEAYICKTNELNLEVRSGRVDTMKLAEDIGLGLRVIRQGKTGFAFTSDLRSTALQEVAEQALVNCLHTAEDPYQRLPQLSEHYQQLDINDPGIKAATVEQKIEMARSAEAAARSFDRRVKVIESSTYQDGEAFITVANSHGLVLSYQSAFCGIYVALVAGDANDSQTGFALDYNLKYDLLKPEEVGREAARRAVRMLGAAPVATRRGAVVLEPFVATGFLSLIAPGLTAEAVRKGRSFFAGKTGTKVVSTKLTVIDDGALPGGISSAPFDGEGVATSRTLLLDKGILQGYLYNTYTAAIDGVQSTGNGVRHSFKDTPEVGTTNFFFENGTEPLEKLLADIKDGIYVTEVMGMHTANPISGDFSVGVAGILIENGELTKPVRGMAIGGNILELLANVDGVGNDLKFFGGMGSPSLRVSEVTISGR